MSFVEEGNVDVAASPGPEGSSKSEAVLRALLLTDLVDSTRLIEKLGDVRAAEIAFRHDRMARDLLPRFSGLEIDKTDGFFILFEHPVDAVGYALAYHQALAELSVERGVQLRARAGIHFGEVLLRENTAGDVARGAKPLEVEGLAKPTAARVMSLAGAKQTLLTEGAFQLARQAALAGGDVTWLAHGPYLFKGVAEPLNVFEVGRPGVSLLEVPPDSEKARRSVAAGDEITLGWRPGPGLEIPRRPGWVLERRLGEGGFGEVWLAVQQDTREPRAFKFCFGAEQLRAMKREVTLFRLLKESLGERPEIVRVLDWSFDQAPYFLETEHVASGSFPQWAEEQGGLAAVPLAQRLELVAGVADALAAAHSVGVLHKDVKPTNILIRQGPEGPRSQLADFGISELTDEKALLARGITVMGMTEAIVPEGSSSLAGSHLYLAPEVAAGQRASVEADLYALGVMLYQVAVGDFQRALASGWRRDLDDPILVEDIATFVDRDPARRPGSAREVAERLRSLERRRAERAEEQRAREEAEATRRALAQAQRRRRVLAAVAAVAVVFGVVVSALAVRANRARADAETARAVAEDRRGQAEGLISFLLGDLRGKLTPLGRLEILEDVGVEAMAYFAAVPEEELSDEELFRRSRAINQIGEVRLELDNLESAEEAFAEALLQAEALAGRDPDNLEWQLGLAHSHYWLGAVRWWRGDLAGAAERMGTYLDVARKLVERQPENPTWRFELASAHINLGQIAQERGEPGEALVQYGLSREIVEELAASEPESSEWRFHLANIFNSIAFVRRSLGELPEALEHYAEELTLRQDLLAEAPENSTWKMHLLINHNQIAVVLEMLGRVREALPHFRQAVAIGERLVAQDPENHAWQRELAANCKSLGGNLRALGRADESLAYSDRHIAIMERLVTADPANLLWQAELAQGRYQKALAFLLLNRLDEARAHAETAVRDLEELTARDPENRRLHLAAGPGHIVLGQVAQRSGRSQEARAAWQRAADLLEPFAARSEDVRFLAPWAEALLRLDRTADALPTVRKLETLGYRSPGFRELCLAKGLAFGLGDAG